MITTIFYRDDGFAIEEYVPEVVFALAIRSFFLIASIESVGESWFAKRDATYVATTAPSLATNEGLYVSLSATAYQKALDKVGWGAPAVFAAEGTAASSPGNNQSIERKPAGGTGHGADTDNNSADFNAPAAPTPRGSVDAAQP